MDIMIPLVTPRSIYYEECTLITAAGNLNSSDVTFLGYGMSMPVEFPVVVHNAHSS
jgi:hypothetical protein